MGKFAELMNQMTVSEKLAQMTQIMGEPFISEGYGNLMGISYGFDIAPELAWNIGSILGMGGAERVKAVQHTYLEKNRNKIPLIFMHDVIHGYRTIFPSPLGMSCSWEPETVMKAAEVAAKEASVSGIQVTFSPMADLARDARWGRVIEGNGEDPMLNSLFTAAYVKGYQGENIKDKYKLASCVKHFAGYGAAESGRDYNTTEISDYQLRENYLPAYRAAVEAGCKLVMSAFNALNGVPCTGNKWLFNEVLRKEWGFQGTVITDCTALYELIPHGFSENPQQAALAALETGMDIEMVSTAYFNELPKLIEDGRVDIQLLDAAVERILELKDEMGLFENPYKDADEKEEERWHLCPEHRSIARDVAVKSMVLLKNNGNVLPLSHDSKIALIGPFAQSNELLDIWKCEGKEEECITLEQGLQGRISFKMVKGCSWEGKEDDAVLMEEAIAAAGDCDVVVLAVGEHPSMSAEAGSRAYITLPQNQQKLAQRILNLGKKTVVVLFNGRPMELGSLNDQADAILVAWYPGTEGGNAVADILLGDKAPSGRLPMSFPCTIGQLPIYYNALPTGRPKYSDENKERFCSRYLDAPNAPAYSFGFGLTYTQFVYGKVTLSSNSMTENDTIVAKVEITNTGSQDGIETVQLYLRDMGGSCARPLKMLKGYQKITLQPNEKKTVSFLISLEMLKYNTLNNGYTAEKGMFMVFIGPDSETQNSVEFTLI